MSTTLGEVVLVIVAVFALSLVGLLALCVGLAIVDMDNREAQALDAYDDDTWRFRD
jgi:hypothetical protein